jgi:hypothetical protein
VKIDPKRVEAIKQISFPRNKKEIQSFLGRINFLRRFVPNFNEMVNHIIDMLKKNHEVKWTIEAKESFSAYQRCIGRISILVSLNYDKEFFIFSFSSEHTIVVVLLQKNEENQGKPIASFSRSLRDVELRYSILEKQAYALVKALKEFKDYILHS